LQWDLRGKCAEDSDKRGRDKKNREKGGYIFNPGGQTRKGNVGREWFGNVHRQVSHTIKSIDKIVEKKSNGHPNNQRSPKVLTDKHEPRKIKKVHAYAAAIHDAVVSGEGERGGMEWQKKIYGSEPGHTCVLSNQDAQDPMLKRRARWEQTPIQNIHGVTGNTIKHQTYTEKKAGFKTKSGTVRGGKRKPLGEEGASRCAAQGKVRGRKTTPSESHQHPRQQNGFLSTGGTSGHGCTIGPDKSWEGSKRNLRSGE